MGTETDARTGTSVRLGHGTTFRLDAVQSRAARTARGWMTGAVATLAAAVSHGVADGAAPSALALCGALVFAGVLGTFLIGRRASLPRLVAVVTSSQLAFHLVFSSLTPGSAAVDTHHGAAGALEPAVAHHGTEPGMWVAHALAMLGTIVFLRRAEVALWGLLRQAVASFVPRVLVVGPLPSVPRAAAAAPPWHPDFAISLRALRERAPPVALGA
jgi:hypothetical protein